MDYNFFNLFWTEIPDYTFGFLCVAVAVYFTLKAVKFITGEKEVSKENDSQPVNVPPKPDYRGKIVGVWRSKSDNIQYRIYFWGGPYLVAAESIDEPHDTQYHALICSDDPYRFWLESDDTYSLIYNESADILYNVDKNIILERISEAELKTEEELNKICKELLKKIHKNEED